MGIRLPAIAQAAFVEAWEIGVNVFVDATIQIYDGSGTLLTSSLIEPGPAVPDWKADLTDDNCPCDWSFDWNNEETDILTIRLSGYGFSKTYVYVPVSTRSTDSFWIPSSAINSPDIVFDVLNDGTVTVASGISNDHFEDVFTGNFVFPYDGDYFCTQTTCTTAWYQQVNFFLSPVDYIPDSTTRTFLFAPQGDTVFRSEWSTVWDVPNLALEFQPNRRFVVEGDLDATDVEFSLGTDGDVLVMGDFAVNDAIFDFGADASVTVEGDFDATNVTFKSAYATPSASTGWDGITFLSGSDGYFNNVSVSGVGGYGGYSVKVVDANPGFIETNIQDAAGYGIHGLYVTGSSAHPTFKIGTITGQTGSGIVLQSLAFISLQGSTISGNSGWGMIAGFGTDGFLSPLFGDPVGEPGNTFSENNGGGIDAYLGADLEMAYYFYPTGGFHADGYNLFVNNALDGLQSRSSAILRSGTLSTYRMNSLFGNGAYQAEAAGSGSSVQARCNWWSEDEDVRFDVNESSGGIVSNDYFLGGNPIGQQTPPSCSDGSPPMPRVGTANETGDAVSPTQSTRVVRDELFDAIELTIADALLGAQALASIVDHNRDASISATALLELGVLASRQDVSKPTRESAFATLDEWLSSTHSGLKTAAARSLVLAHARLGSLDTALALADSLFLGTAATEDRTFAGLAKVFLYAELGDVTQAWGALDEVESLRGTHETGDFDFARQDLVARFGIAPISAQPRIAPGTQVASKDGVQSVDGVVQVASFFPNPMSHSGSVVYTLKSDGRVNASLYDALGRMVARLHDGVIGRGLHTLTVPDLGLAAGVYFFRLTVDRPDSGTSIVTFPVSIVE